MTHHRTHFRRSRLRRAGVGVSLLVLGLALAGCGSDGNSDEAATSSTASTLPTSVEPSPVTVVEGGDDLLAVLRNDPRFSGIVELIEIAGATDTLATGGPYTLFAPTNDALATVPADQLEALRDDPDALSAVLADHVVSGVYLAETLVDANGTTITAVGGAPLTILATGEGLAIVGATDLDLGVEPLDLTASNGVIHAISGVILPLEG